MKLWHNYNDISTDSLWIIDKRDNSGIHSGHYHGNFIPQIPYQLFSRYTKKGDWILDPFMGSGTSIIEAINMERNAIGIELQQNVAQEVSDRLGNIKINDTKYLIFQGDSGILDINRQLQNHNINKVQFIIYHPPYWDIIKFSNDKQDLSNADTLQNFLYKFGKTIDNTSKLLEKNRYCALVIGDKYANSQIIPLGFYCMNLFMERNFLMKAIIVKNFDETKGKNGTKAIWRYRALASDFYIFKHEYIFVFKKLG
ncbi:MAG TPA: hypothetical protein H9804_00260 [Candidatus Mucispirillum faecigallinarum]|uniref:Methyltransferase n=1 Tax=Candidatus Mucispirillum faecigallinarum TaxID=2838699 RepID=A0A9D2K9J6_9BACT|nr:hypothetical protein [Candidatus Mucispirillum faecigallinarum]